MGVVGMTPSTSLAIQRHPNRKKRPLPYRDRRMGKDGRGGVNLLPSVGLRREEHMERGRALAPAAHSHKRKESSMLTEPGLAT